MNPRRLQTIRRQINRQLAGWAVLSLVAALPLWRRGSAFRRAFSLQLGVWGAIDGLIAGVGALGARRERVNTPQQATAAAAKLRRLLLINAALDVGYVLTGLLLARRRRGEPAVHPRRGHGLGVLLQGGFLLLFDTIHALRLSAAMRQGAR